MPSPPLSLRLQLTAYMVAVAVRASIAQVLATAREALIYPAMLGNRPPRPGDVTVSAAWLNKLLRSYGLLAKDARVSAVRVCSLSDNRGLASCILSVVAELEYACGAAAASTNPADALRETATLRLVLKMSHCGFDGRRAVISGGRSREGVFYSAIASAPGTRFCGLPPPRVYYTHGSALMGEYVMLMEDLSHEGCVGVNFIFGNQIWGVPEALRGVADPLRVLGAAFRGAAALHAAYWCDPSLFATGWLKGADWYRGRGRVEWENAVARARRMWGRTRAAAAAGGLADVSLDPRVCSILDASFEATSWEALQAHLRNPTVPWTLCHGDFHAANMMFLREPGTPGAPAAASSGCGGALYALDWSEVGPWEGTTDLAQMVISDVPPALFVPHASALVKDYWEALLRGGVSKDAYSYEMCWDGFCRGGMERWLWLFAVISGIPSMPAQAVQYFHDQLLAFSNAFGNGRTCYALKPVVCIA